jgi:FlgD Ig-like domain
MKRILLAVALAILPSLAAAQAPTYLAQLLAESTGANGMNQSAEIIGGTTVGGNLRAFVVGPAHPYQLLPLPLGMVSSTAIDITNAGVVVGAVSVYYSPEFAGQAAAWFPDGAGGYSIQLLGRLPGHVASLATAANNVGDIVGYSSNGTFRYPVLFTAPAGVMDLSSTGVFDPVDVNDSRILVDHSFTAKRLDLNTMVAEDLGVPPAGAGSYVATRATVINEAGQVAGAAILATSTSCDRTAARYTDGVGWQIFSSCGPNNSVYDMNDLGDAIMSLNVDVYVRFEGLGSYRVQDLIVSDVGQWYVINSYGITINNARQMVVFATNPTTGQSGALLLTQQPTAVDAASPAWTPTASSIRLSNDPNPFNSATTIRFALPASGRVLLAVYDAGGRRVATLANGNLAAGQLAVDWDGREARGRPAPSGIYFARIETESFTATRRMVVLR